MSKAAKRKARARQRTKQVARAATRPVAPVAPKRVERRAVPQPVAEASGPTGADSAYAFLSRTGLPRVSAIARRDFTALFVSPVGWVVAGLFVFLVSGFGFIATVLAGQQATMAGVFGVSTHFLMFALLPPLTLRGLPAERPHGTLALLATAPARPCDHTR